MRGLSIILFCLANVAFASVETNSLEYIVRSGDTLWVIARKYKTSHEKLCALNNKPADWRLIKTGQKIIVPMVQPYFSAEELHRSGHYIKESLRTSNCLTNMAIKLFLWERQMRMLRITKLTKPSGVIRFS